MLTCAAHASGLETCINPHAGICRSREALEDLQSPQDLQPEGLLEFAPALNTCFLQHSTQLLHAQEASLQQVEAGHTEGQHEEGLDERGADLEELPGSSSLSLKETASEGFAEGMPVVDSESEQAEASSEEAELEDAEPEDLDEFDREVESWLVRLTLSAR